MASSLGAAIQPFLPDFDLILLVAPAGALYTAACAQLAGHLRVTRGVPAPYTRKIFHFAIFTMAGVIHFLAALPGVVVFGSVVSLAVLWAVYRGDGFPFYEALARPSDEPRRTFFIVMPLLTTALGGIVGNLLFPDVAYVGYLVCGWGDALGEPVGTRWGRHRYRIPSIAGVRATRSLEGSSAVLIGGASAAFIGLVSAGVPPSTAAYVAVTAGVAGALVEAVSTHGLDNLTVQLAAAATAAPLV